MKLPKTIEYYDVESIPELRKLIIESDDGRRWEIDPSDQSSIPKRHFFYYFHNQGMRSYDEIKISLYGDEWVDNSTLRQNRSRYCRDNCPPLKDCFFTNSLREDNQQTGFFLVKNDVLKFDFLDKDGKRLDPPIRTAHFKSAEIDPAPPAVLADQKGTTPNEDNEEVSGQMIDLRQCECCHQNGDFTIMEILQKSRHQIAVEFNFDDTDCVWAMVCLRQLGSWADKRFLHFQADTPATLKGVHLEVKGPDMKPIVFPVKFPLAGRRTYHVELTDDVRNLEHIQELCFTFVRRTDVAKNGAGKFSIRNLCILE